MVESALQPEAGSRVADEGDLWMPPGRMWRYQIVKLVGGALVAAIFGGWLIIQWSNPVMRWLCIALIGITAWVVIASIRDDLLRCKGRQLRLSGRRMTVIAPDGERVIDVRDIVAAEWREDAQDTAGLWLYDRQEQVLAHLDTAYLGDQTEARSFLHWARQRAPMNFDVRWPSA